MTNVIKSPNIPKIGKRLVQLIMVGSSIWLSFLLTAVQSKQKAEREALVDTKCTWCQSAPNLWITPHWTHFKTNKPLWLCSPGANFINKVRTIYLKLCVRCFLRSAYVSFIKTSWIVRKNKNLRFAKTSYF